MDGASAAVLSVLPKAAAVIIGAATNAEGQLSAAQPQVLVLLLANLPVMPAVQQPLLFQRLLPLVAAIPSAAERCRGLARLWQAVLRYDWSNSAADKAARQQQQRAGAPAPAAPPSQLQQLLLEPGIKEAISGQAGSGDIGAALAAAAARPPVFPAYREELVGTLLYVLLSHARGTAAAGAGAGAGGPAGASSLLAEASEMQALVEGAEWLASAKTALQVRRHCCCRVCCCCCFAQCAFFLCALTIGWAVCVVASAINTPLSDAPPVALQHACLSLFSPSTPL
jgi:hypothetical protein